MQDHCACTGAASWLEKAARYTGTQPLPGAHGHGVPGSNRPGEGVREERSVSRARFMTCFAFRCSVSLQQETGRLPVPRVFLHFHMPTQLFQLGRFLPVTRRRTVRKSIREKRLRALKLGRRGGYRIQRSDSHKFLRKRETIKDDDLSSSCGEHRTKEE
jgi:excisionase family DNA binding protein